MRPLVVEEELETGKGGGDARHGQRTVVEAPELDPGRAVRPLHAAVPLGPPGRQDVQALAHLRCGAVPRRHPRTRPPFMAHEPRCRPRRALQAARCTDTSGNGSAPRRSIRKRSGFGPRHSAGGGARVDPRHHEPGDRTDGRRTYGSRTPSASARHRCRSCGSMRAKARCTSSPGLRALEPYFHRVANAAQAAPSGSCAGAWA